MMVKPGYVGPFVAHGRPSSAPGRDRVGVEATMTDEGNGGRIIATVSAAFRRVG